MFFQRALLWVAITGAVLGDNVPRLLFVGNSFTYVNDLDLQLQNIARSLGKDISVNRSVIGGCTLYAQEAHRDRTTAALLEEEWDFIILQDYSALPTVQKARELYLKPAIKDFASQKKEAQIVLYMTWGYHDGADKACPSSDNAACFPLGSLASLTNPSCTDSDAYQASVGTFACMGYALARGYWDAANSGSGDGGGAAAVVVPAGLAWQVVRNVSSIPHECQAAIDKEYSAAAPVALPFTVPDATLPDYMLYRVFDKVVDKHPNVAGQYLNALTFYAALFGSPIGAGPPLDTGDPRAGNIPLTTEQLGTLQRAALGAVQSCGAACNLS